MAITLTSKQRAYLRGLASTEKPLFSIGKSNLTPEITNAVAEAFANREIIKVNILKSTADEQDEEGLACMRVLGKNMAYFLKCRAAADAAGIPLPTPEPPVFTNFIR